ncbi:MAG: YdbL family protein [Opitutaceae bacterium]
MKISVLLRLGFLITSLLAGTVATRAAEDLGAVRSRMEKRIGSINALKDRGAVGENNRGLLEGRGALGGADQQVVNDENSDRRKVYAALAAQTGAGADEVGRKRAAQLADLARPGHWVQTAGGEWRRK